MDKKFLAKFFFNLLLAMGIVTAASPLVGQVAESNSAVPSVNEEDAAQSAVATTSQAATSETQNSVNAVVPEVQIREIKTIDSPQAVQEQVQEPRFASNSAVLSVASSPVAAAPHPLDRAIEMANRSLTKMRAEVKDYSGLFFRRECFNGTKSEPTYMQLKIRCPRPNESANVPFSIYMKFLKPRQSAGRECIWVDGVNESKIIAHEARGLIGLRRFYLEPTGMIAMRESRYPIYEAGIENLIKKLIEKAERDRAAGPCIVNFKDNCEVNSRKCSMIEVCHNEQKQPYDFHIARVFIDQETQFPIAYAAYDWPLAPGGKPRLMEEYHYLNLKINVGLSERDFSADNPSYGYPKR